VVIKLNAVENMRQTENLSDQRQTKMGEVPDDDGRKTNLV